MPFGFGFKRAFSFGTVGGAASSAISYLLRLGLNPAETAPLTALTGTTATQVATSAVVIPTEAGVMEMIAANLPAIEGGNYEGTGTWSTTNTGATGTLLASGLTRYSGGTYSPGGNLGVMAEPADTVSGLHSRDLSNAAWSATNCAGVKNATGTDDVANSASTLTASGADATILQTITLASGARGFFPYIKRKTGTGAVYITIDNGGTWTEVTVNASTWVRGSSIKTAANPIFGFKLATSGDAIYVDHANLFNTAVATSPVATTTAAVTRAARYTTEPGANFGTKTRFDLVSKEALSSAAGRTTRLLDDGTRKLSYEAPSGLLVFRDESQVMGSDVLGGIGAFTSWTGDNPTGWTLDFTENATNYVAENANGMKFVCDNTDRATQITKGSVLTVGKTYKVVSDTYSIADGGYSLSGYTNTTVSAPGVLTSYIIATGTSVSIRRSGPVNAIIISLTITEVAEIIYDVDLSANTVYTIGLDLGTAAKMYVDGAEVATATFPAPVTWGTTVYLGASDTGTQVLNGSLSCLISSSDASFNAAGVD